MNTPTNNGPFDPEFVAEAAISQSAQPLNIRIDFVPKPPDGTLVDFQDIRKSIR